MHEDDRNKTLELYNNIFDEVGNETAVLQMLVSPTRQAVNLARAYDSKERKLQTEEDIPAYLLVIEDLRRQADTIMSASKTMNQDQLSLFEEPDVADSVFDKLGDFALTSPSEEAEGEPEREIGRFPDEDSARPESGTKEPTEESGEVDAFADAVEDFLAGFTLPDELGEETEDDEEKTEVRPRRRVSRQPLRRETETEPAAKREPVTQKTDPRPDIVPQPIPEPEEPAGGRPRIALLILYILLAVPVTLVCICVLLGFAALALGLGAVGLHFGIAGLLAAFGFSVFADILLVFGLALALAAIGLLIFWLFIWLLVGAIPKTIRGAVRLGRRLCYKEVAV